MKKLIVFAIVLVAAIGYSFVNTPVEKPAKPIKLVSYHGRSIVFYNVENLFDTIDQPNVIDEDFLPAGKLKWNTERYNTKLKHIVEAVTLNLKDNPVLIGFAEIENGNVVMDVAHTGRLAQTKYLLAHKDSPDARGIDCALLYDSERFKPLVITNLAVTIDSIPDFKTRDVLYVKGEFYNEKTLHVFVNHWPSRRGGEKESEIRRIRAAQVAREKIDQILKEDPKANIVLMGDFNDHPNNVSIENYLKAKPITDKTADLYNLLYDDQLAGKGTHNFQNQWGVLDQFIVSATLFNGKKGIRLATKDATIVFEDLLLYTAKDGSKKPSTTYGGDKYFGGYSDHLPIQLLLK
jgi:predicted extracellular nuclease